MTQQAPEDRFSGLAEGYDRYRPRYPEALLVHIAEACKNAQPRRALDVGAGTGISTRQIAVALGNTWKIIGIEPNADMRHQAEAQEDTNSRITYLDRRAESLGFDPASTGLITVAQAIHWFDRQAFYAGTGEILAPGGCLAVLYNNRGVSGPGLLGEFEGLMEREMPGYDRQYRHRAAAGEQEAELAALDWVGKTAVHKVPWQRALSPDDFAELMLSRSKLRPFVEKHGRPSACDQIRVLAERYCDADGKVRIDYISQVTIATRRLD